jgi:hypothetical protein
MLRLASIVTALLWAALLCWVVFNIFASGFHYTSELIFAVIVILMGACAIFLSVAAAKRRSPAAAQWLFILSILSALWSGIGAWIMISPITVMGLRYFVHLTLMSWLWLIELLTMFLLPWLWGIVFYRSRKKVTR